MLSLALDTCLLLELNEWGRGTEEEHIPVELVSDLSSLLRTGRAELLLDSAGRIQAEYMRYLRDYDLGHRLWRAAERAGRLTWRSDHLSAKAVQVLDGEGFDPADRVFLDVSCRVGGAYATTEVKHLRPGRRALISRACAITVLSLPELHEHCSAMRDPSVVG